MQVFKKKQLFKFASDINAIDELKQQTMTLDEVNNLIKHQPIITITNAYKWIHNPPKDLSYNKHIYLHNNKFLVKDTGGTSLHTYDEIKSQLHANFHILMDNTIDFLKPTDVRVFEMKHPVMSEQQVENIEIAKKYHDSIGDDVLFRIVLSVTPSL